MFVNGGFVSRYNYPERPDAQGEAVFVKELIPHIDTTYRTMVFVGDRGLSCENNVEYVAFWSFDKSRFNDA